MFPCAASFRMSFQCQIGYRPASAVGYLSPTLSGAPTATVASRHKTSVLDKTSAGSAFASDQWRLKRLTPDLAHRLHNRRTLSLQNFNLPGFRGLRDLTGATVPFSPKQSLRDSLVSKPSQILQFAGQIYPSGWARPKMNRSGLEGLFV